MLLMNTKNISVVVFKGFWFYLCSFSVFNYGYFFFSLFGASRVEKTEKEDPVACFQVLKLILSLSLNRIPPCRLRFRMKMSE